MKTKSKKFLLLPVIALLSSIGAFQGCSKEVEQTPTETNFATEQSSLSKISDKFTGFRLRTGRLKEKLNLSDEQAAEIKSLIKRHIADTRANLPSDFSNYSLEEKKKYFKNNRQELKQEIKSVLTDEQISQLGKIKQEKLPVWTEKRKELKSERKQFLSTLNISDEQKAELRDIIKQRLDERLSAGYVSTEIRKERIESLRHDLVKVLTSDQIALLKEYRQKKTDKFKSRLDN